MIRGAIWNNSISKQQAEDKLMIGTTFKIR